MDTDLEGAIVLTKLKDAYKDRMFDAPQLGALIRRECPHWTEEQVEVLFKDADKTGSGMVSFSDLVDFVLDEVPVVISSPGLSSLAKGLRAHLDGDTEDVVSWDAFKSGDSNTRFQWRTVVGRSVVVLFDTEDQSRLFEQLSLLQALQGFPVPDSEDSPKAWKTYSNSGKYCWGRANDITVVVPWYRPCQMERTSRWHLAGNSGWTNANPQGAYLDVPSAQTLVRLLATPGPPLPGVQPQVALDGRPLDPLWRPPMRLLFLDLHEPEPVARAVSDLGVEVRFERVLPYFLSKFVESERFSDPSTTFVLFPDKGAYMRNKEFVTQKTGLQNDHILWINKKRVGDKVVQDPELFFEASAGSQGEKTSFSPKDHVLVIDDFTNSGGTLFGAVSLAQSKLVVPAAGIKAGTTANTDGSTDKSKEDSKDSRAGEPEHASKEESKDKSEESKDKSEESKDKPEESKDKSKDDPKGNPAGESELASKEEPEDKSKESKDESKDNSQRESRDKTQVDSKDTSKDVPTDEKKGSKKKDDPKDASKDEVKGTEESQAEDDEGLITSIFVTHTVASYDESTARGILEKLQECGPGCRYFTTDTVARSASILSGHPQVEVIAIADFLSGLLK